MFLSLSPPITQHHTKVSSFILYQSLSFITFLPNHGKSEPVPSALLIYLQITTKLKGTHIGIYQAEMIHCLLSFLTYNFFFEIIVSESYLTLFFTYIHTQIDIQKEKKKVLWDFHITKLILEKFLAL